MEMNETMMKILMKIVVLQVAVGHPQQQLLRCVPCRAHRNGGPSRKGRAAANLSRRQSERFKTRT